MIANFFKITAPGVSMRSKYWRFSYDENALPLIVDSKSLPFPELNFPSAKHNTKEKVIADLREGSIIILANFNYFEATGTARAIGIVKNLQSDHIDMLWRKLIPSRNMHPHKIGAEQWKNENVFCFNLPRAKEFKIDVLATKYFPESI